MIRVAINPADVIATAVWSVVAVPLGAAVLAFTGDSRLRKIGRWLLALAWLACAAAVGGCLWLTTRKSSGIGNGVFLLIAFVPGILGAIWFVVWRIARRTDDLRSLPPAERQVEELADIEEGLEMARRELRAKLSRAESLWISSEERARLRAEIPLLKITVDRLEAERAKRPVH